MSEASSSKPEMRPSTAARAIMPPYIVLHDFLDVETVAGLLDYALDREAAFTPTGTGSSLKDAVKPEVRRSVGILDLGPFRPILKSKVLDLVPEIVARLRATPVDAPTLELEMVAHNEGAFYKRHIDTQTTSRHTDIRVLSSVYYFHATPKLFSGGALRLYAFGGGADKDFVDIEPAHNTLLVFPSWASHEVMPVSCPSGRFADSRFAVNCWVRRKRADTP